KQWLQKHNLDAEERLWHHIQIEKEWENALESILHERLNSLAFSRLETILNWQDDLPPGKLVIYELLHSDQYSTALSRTHESAMQTERSRTEWKTLSTFLTCSDAHLSALLQYWL